RGTAGQFAGEMLMRGTTRHTRQQIQDEFDKLKARVSVSPGPNSVSASIETVRDNLPAVLRLTAEILREPSSPANEFEQLKQEALAGVEEQQREPESVASTQFDRHLNPFPKGDVRYTSTPEEDIADINATKLEDVKKFYADFYGGSNGEMAVVG